MEVIKALRIADRAARINCPIPPAEEMAQISVRSYPFRRIDQVYSDFSSIQFFYFISATIHLLGKKRPPIKSGAV